MAQRRHRANTLERRNALLRATIEVVAEGGFAAITHRAVTEKAGLPITTIGYFFSSIDELAEEALRTFTQRESEEQIALAADLDRAGVTPAQVIEAFAASSHPRYPDTLALLESYLRAARDDRWRELLAEALDASRQVASTAARLAGAPDPEGVAATLCALAFGYAAQEAAVREAPTPHSCTRRCGHYSSDPSSRLATRTRHARFVMRDRSSLGQAPTYAARCSPVGWSGRRRCRRVCLRRRLDRRRGPPSVCATPLASSAPRRQGLLPRWSGSSNGPDLDRMPRS